MNLKTFSTRRLAVLSVLIALEIILSRFASFSAWNVKIGFSFVPIAIAGMLYGPLPAAAVAAVSDYLGATLFPIGSYFPGFTLTAALTGAVFGLLLRGKRSAPKLLLAVAVNQLLLSLLLNTLWISILYSSSYTGLLSTRILQVLVLAPLQYIVLSGIGAALSRTDIRAVLSE